MAGGAFNPRHGLRSSQSSGRAESGRQPALGRPSSITTRSGKSVVKEVNCSSRSITKKARRNFLNRIKVNEISTSRLTVVPAVPKTRQQEHPNVGNTLPFNTPSFQQLGDACKSVIVEAAKKSHPSLLDNRGASPEEEIALLYDSCFKALLKMKVEDMEMAKRRTMGAKDAGQDRRSSGISSAASVWGVHEGVTLLSGLPADYEQPDRPPRRCRPSYHDNAPPCYNHGPDDLTPSYIVPAMEAALHHYNSENPGANFKFLELIGYVKRRKKYGGKIGMDSVVHVNFWAQCGADTTRKVLFFSEGHHFCMPKEAYATTLCCPLDHEKTGNANCSICVLSNYQYVKHPDGGFYGAQ